MLLVQRFSSYYLNCTLCTKVVFLSIIFFSWDLLYFLEKRLIKVFVKSLYGNPPGNAIALTEPLCFRYGSVTNQISDSFHRPPSLTCFHKYDVGGVENNLTFLLKSRFLSNIYSWTSSLLTLKTLKDIHVPLKSCKLISRRHKALSKSDTHWKGFKDCIFHLFKHTFFKYLRCKTSMFSLQWGLTPFPLVQLLTLP